MFEQELSGPDKPLTVGQLSQQIKAQLEGHFPRVWVIGEISNFKAASSGHWYFSLKDDRSQIRANIWRSVANRVSLRPKVGMEVLVSGSLNVYQPRGEYSIVVDHIQEVGVGRLRLEFEALKKRLLEEGLFDDSHKVPLPLLPRKIGIVTSPTGAALRDMLRVLRHRFSGIHILLAPARVQGKGAAEEIAVGIQYLDRFGECDVIIAGRGGGSEEDLWAFNEEIVARAIFAAQTPVISAVGHEVDFTIADFVADVRAATPSNAAELVVLSRNEYEKMIALAMQRVHRNMQNHILRMRQRVRVSEGHPIFMKIRSRINDLQRRLADLDHGMVRRMESMYQNRKMRLMASQSVLDARKLRQVAIGLETRLNHAKGKLSERMKARFEHLSQKYAALVMRLADLSPLRVLSRGFSVVYTQKGTLVRNPEQVRIGEVLRVQMAEGELLARAIEAPEPVEQPDLFD